VLLSELYRSTGDELPQGFNILLPVAPGDDVDPSVETPAKYDNGRRDDAIVDRT